MLRAPLAASLYRIDYSIEAELRLFLTSKK